MQRQNHEIDRRAGMAPGRERRIERPSGLRSIPLLYYKPRALFVADVELLRGSGFGCGLETATTTSNKRSKLIRGFESETPAGFRSRRGFGHDPAPVTPDNALFASYKTPRVHHAARHGGCVAARGAGAEW
jgi:hypothetical protein